VVAKQQLLVVARLGSRNRNSHSYDTPSESSLPTSLDYHPFGGPPNATGYG
jgi:hypothetical protein